ILAVPAAQAWAANTGDRLELPAAWQAMLWGLAGVGLMNYLPTRYALHALGFSSGQLLLSSEFLLDWTPVSPSPARLAGSVVLAICAISVHWRSPEPRHDLCTFRWLAFRDGWGAFWGLRVFHRVNHTAELGNWPIRLSWAGFVNSKDRKIIVADADPKIALQVRQVMDSLLWRFERASED
ncbi:MAG TPA: hypothetical protein PJ982_02315, partial [Lacipirellulaceae bacterium]|nr:hypothetical protein [Lacipirellulaceae bacterium]